MNQGIYLLASQPMYFFISQLPAYSSRKIWKVKGPSKYYVTPISAIFYPSPYITKCYFLVLTPICYVTNPKLTPPRFLTSSSKDTEDHTIQHKHIKYMRTHRGGRQAVKRNHTLLPRIQVHALIYEAEAKVHALK